MACGVNILVIIYCAPISRILVWVYYGTRLQYTLLYSVRYGRLIPNNVPNLDYLLHFIEAGLGLVADIGMFDTRLYGNMCSGESW